MNQAEIEANVTLEQALRRADLLAAAAEVSQNISQIMDIDELLPRTVDIICDAYNFYYAGIFLIDEAREFAVLKAGRGQPGQIMIENHHKLAVGGNSMIGACTARNEARISLDVDTEKVWYPNPVLPETRSEMALPLAIGNRVIGAVTVQSIEAAAFSDEDISSLQAMANQLAIAIENARQRQELEETHAELLRAKTHEAIATATGDAIHWIGNKADPIRSAVDRTRTDLQVLTVLMAKLLNEGAVSSSSFTQLIQKEAAAVQQTHPGIAPIADKLSQLPLDRLEQRLSLSSTLDDLQIIEDAAAMILKIKEDLIGPAREQAPRPTMIDDVVKDTVTGMDLSAGLVTISRADNLPLVVADPVQLNRVFTNLLKNAIEATEQQPQPRIDLIIRVVDGGDFVAVDVADNGSGIAPEHMDKIWITFHTTKGIRGHSGFGLPASRLILEQTGGRISATSRLGQGSTFTVQVPVFKSREAAAAKSEQGKGKILLIDDNDYWRHFATGTLKAAGYKVESPAKGFDVSNANRFDLVLIDDILAGTDSLAVLNALKTSGAVGKTLMVSSNPRVERTKERMLVGIKNLVPKPYTQNGLLSEVAQAIR
ncbi:MAG: GAF domain-containing protein [Anaerolineae bacterium]|nr:GAF domain-containing protein [Anaerolineae bacterium]MCB9105999.1 GAF domain-containing protein [Anaerolineales bacterium]